MAINLEVIDTFDFHQAPVYALAANEHHLYSAGGDRNIFRYHKASGQWAAELFAITTESTFALHIDGDHLMSGGIAGNLNVFDVQKKTILHRFESHEQGIYSITSNNEFLITGGGDGKIHLWKKNQWQIVRTIWTAQSKIRKFIWSEDKKFMAAIDNAGYFRIFETQWWNEVFTYKHTTGWTGGSYYTEKKVWLLGSQHGEIVAFQSANPSPIVQIQAHQNAIYEIVNDEEWPIIISASLDKSVKCWSNQSLELQAKIERIGESPLRSVNTLLKWNGLLAFAGDDKKIHLTKICFFKE